MRVPSVLGISVPVAVCIRLQEVQRNSERVRMQLESLLSKSQNLPAIPEVVRDLLRSFNDERANIGTIAKKISVDQALTGKVLRLANSARYGVARKIASIDDAILVLGFGALRTLVVASGLTSAFKAPPSFDIRQFWRCSLATAGYAAWLAKQGGHREDIGFTGGMMLHAGVLLLHMEEPEKSQAIDKAVAHGGFRPDLERAVFGFSHIDVSSELAVRWNFPDEIIGGMQDFADPLTTASFAPYGAIYRIADHLSDAMLRDGEASLTADAFVAQLINEMGMDPDALQASLPPPQKVLEGLEELLG
jgi:HD-like signal output (HDOD) protein